MTRNTDTNTDDGEAQTDIEAAMEQMEADRRRHNAEVRARETCQQCDGDVPDEDFSAKFAAAGGVLAGPFCSTDCHWRWLNE